MDIDFNSFYKNYIVETTNGVFQVFQSWTYGEIVISILLLTQIILFVMKWFWEVIR